MGTRRELLIRTLLEEFTEKALPDITDDNPLGWTNIVTPRGLSATEILCGGLSTGSYMEHMNGNLWIEKDKL